MEHAPRVTWSGLTAPLFWPLWGLTLALQLFDTASVALGHALGAPLGVTEGNPIVLHLEARYGFLAALGIKSLTVAVLLAFLAGLYLLGRAWRVRALSALCLVFVSGLALYSTVILWSNLAIVLR